MGTYIILSNTEAVDDEEGFARTTGIMSKTSNRKLNVTHQGESLYFRRKLYSENYEMPMR